MGTLYDVTFRSGAYLEARPGALSLQFLVLRPIGALSLLLLGSRRGVHVLWLASSYLVLLFQFTPYLRYLAPVSPLLVLVCVAFLKWSRRYSKSLWRTSLVFTLAAAMLNLGYLTPAGGTVEFLNSTHRTDMRVGVFERPFLAGL